MRGFLWITQVQINLLLGVAVIQTEIAKCGQTCPNPDFKSLCSTEWTESFLFVWFRQNGSF